VAISESTKKMREKFRQELEDNCSRPADMKMALMSALRPIPTTQSTSVFMSSGMDSHAVLWAMLALGHRPLITSFTLDTHESTDFKAAKHASEVYGLEFNPVILNSSEKHLKSWVKHAVGKLGLIKKSSIECIWPMMQAVRNCPAKHIVVGFDSDIYFATAKKPSMHAKDIVKKYWQSNFRGDVKIQNTFFQNLAYKKDKIFHIPFTTCRVWAEMLSVGTYEEMHKPQKRQLREAFADDLKKCIVKPHQNFQLGDTNIADNFSDKLLSSDWNIRNSKSVVAIYNDVRLGKIPKELL